MGHVSKKNKTSAGRFWGFNRIYGAQDGLKDTVYMTRLWVWRLRFHLFHRGDQDPDCHDHPWGFWTFPLRSYVEEVLVPTEITAYPVAGKPTTIQSFYRQDRIVRAFRLHYRPAEHKHRVIGPLKGRGMIPTIVWTEKASRKWGFTKLDRAQDRWCWVPWKKYVFEGGKDAPCE